MTFKKSLFIFFLLLPIISFAHGGHGFFKGNELAHFLTSPMHAVPILLVIAVGIYYQRKKTQKTKL